MRIEIPIVGGMLLWFLLRSRVAGAFPMADFPSILPGFPALNFSSPKTKALGEPVLRLFVIETSDEPLPLGGLDAIKTYWWVGTNWIGDSVDVRLSVDPNPILLKPPFTTEDIRSSDNLPRDLFDWMQLSTSYPPRGQGIYERNETWIFLVRGAGGFAGSSPRTSTAEDVNWSIMGDAVLSAMLSGYGLEENVAPEYVFTYLSPEQQLPYVTPAAQTGTLVHEVMHSAFGLGHTSGIMTEWFTWPNAAIDPLDRTKIRSSEYVI